MKRFGLLSLFTVLLICIGCSSKNKSEFESISASGFEPGWELKITKVNKIYQFVILSDSGAKKQTGDLFLEDTNNLSIVKLKGSSSTNLPVFATYTKSKCLNNAGENVGGEIIFKIGPSLYRDCAKIVR